VRQKGIGIMTKLRALPFASAFALIAGLGLMAPEARAGSLTVVLDWPGHSLTITGSPFATLSPTSSGESLTYNVTTLNAFLLANGSALQFAAGAGASDNQIVATSHAVLTSNGTLNVDQASAGSTTMTIDVFKTDWNVPVGPKGTLVNAGSTTFGLTAAGDTATYNSWYNPDNSANGKILGAGLQTYTSTGPIPNAPLGSPLVNTSAAIPSFVVPFSLTNETVITLTKTGLNGENVQYQVQTTVDAIPEPASAVLLATALPVVGWGLLRRRRAALRA
jgi:hypothetical protein